MKLKALFSKAGDIKFISHLDLMRLFQRALRRADLPIEMTQGFSPHLKMSITRALKLGVESASEGAVFCLAKEIDSSEFINRFNEELPACVRIISAANL